MNSGELPKAPSMVVHKDLDEMIPVVARRIAELAVQAMAGRGYFVSRWLVARLSAAVIKNCVDC